MAGDPQYKTTAKYRKEYLFSVPPKYKTTSAIFHQLRLSV